MRHEHVREARKAVRRGRARANHHLISTTHVCGRVSTDFHEFWVLSISSMSRMQAGYVSPAPNPLPRELSSRAFTATHAAQLGVSLKMLRGRRFERLHHGVHANTQREREPENFVEEIMLRKARDYLPLLRDGEVFSHTTALLLYNAPILVEPQLHVTATWPTQPARGRNVAGHRTRKGPMHVLAHNNLPCVPPEVALVQCEKLLSFRELIVAIDHLILPRRNGEPAAPLIPRDRLGEYLGAYSGPGALRLRAAFEVSRIGAESRYETLTRFELARMGLDTLELQADLYDAGGRWIGRFDLFDKEKRKIVEYDGEQHRTNRKQYLRDEKKILAALDAGYKVLRLHKEELRRSELAETRRELCEFLDEQPRKLSRRMARYFAEPL